MLETRNRPQRLDSVKFNQLKNLFGITVDFSPNPITGIFGSNGCGKSTILHALACVYKPSKNSKREDYKFSSFFLPTTLGTWIGSEFVINYSVINGTNGEMLPDSRTYSKSHDRWTPKYDRRPAREVFYIGISSCVPDMEKEKSKSKIQLSLQGWEDPAFVSVLMQHTSYVMNRPYQELKRYASLRKKYLGLELSGISYPSLYMGAGEQRIIEILRCVLAVPDHSLILIDEIDLTLHTEALMRLVETLNNICLTKNLQIVFTSHREELLKCEYINIRHLINDRSDGKTRLCIDRTTPECIRRMTGSAPRTLEILVEDDLAEALVRAVVRNKGIEAFCTVTKYGSIENSFQVGAGLILRGERLDNTLIVTDGDMYRTLDSRREKVNRLITGNDAASAANRNRLLDKIKQFSLAEGTRPEVFIAGVLGRLPDSVSSLVPLVKSVGIVADHHELLNTPIINSGMPREIALSQIADILASQPEWSNYVQEIADWIDDRIVANNLY